jgi:hypothetical protein
MLLQYIIDETTNHNKKAGILSLDLRKAFDMTDHYFLNRLLKQYGFGTKFIHLIRTLYNGANSCAITEGIHTGHFELTRSCRQGCPLSAFLFLLIIEPLLRLINKDEIYKGVKIGDQNVTSLAYADDVTVFPKNEEDFARINTILSEFENISGLGTAPEKSELLLLGAWKRDPPRNCLYNIKDEVKITGVIYSNNKETMTELNFDPVIMKIRNQVKILKQRGLSVIARTTTTKSLLYSQLQFIASMVTPNDKQIKQINSIVYDYIWKGVDQVSRNYLSQPYERGGLNLETPKQKCMAAMAANIARTKICKHPWEVIFDKEINSNLGSHGLLGHLDENWIKGSNIMSTTKQILMAWNFFCTKTHESVQNLESIPLWGQDLQIGTHRIQTGSERILIKKGISTIGDLVYSNGDAIEMNDMIDFGLNASEAFKLLGLMSKIKIKKLIPTRFEGNIKSKWSKIRNEGISYKNVNILTKTQENLKLTWPTQFVTDSRKAII